MEHRLRKRAKAELSVCFYERGVPVAIGKIRNLAPGGVFVETTYRPENGVRCLEIAFVARNDIVGSLNPVSALIIHHTSEGFGLMLDDADPIDNLPIPNAPEFESTNRLRQV